VIWTADLIKARFVEAADTERRLPAARLAPSAASGWWPEFKYSVADMNGWGGKRLSEHRQDFWHNARLAPSAGAVSRHEEVLTWTADFIHDEMRRRLVWLWAFCTATDRDFSAALRSKGIARSTAYDRLNKLWARLEVDFRKEDLLLRSPDDKWIGHQTGSRGISCGIDYGGCDDAPPVSPTSIIADGARPDLRLPEDLVEFEKYLASVNRDRRREQERRKTRRRKALGLA